MAVVAGAEQDVRPGVKELGIVGREKQREAPLEAVLHRLDAGAHDVVRPDGDVVEAGGLVVVAGEQAVVGAGEDEAGVGGIGGDPAAFSAADLVPVGGGDGSAVAAAGGFDGGVVLLGAVDVVRKVVVEGDTVELGGGLVIFGREAFTAVEGDIDAAVVGLDHAVGVVVGDPKVVVVAVAGGDGFEGAAAIDGAVEAGVEGVHGVGVFGVGEDAGVVPGALLDVALAVDLGPVGAAVVGVVDAAVFGFNDNPKAVGLGRRGGDADAAEDALGQAGIVAEFFPGVAAVGGLPEAAVGAAALKGPGLAEELVDGGVEDLGVAGVDRKIDGSGAVALKEDFLPGFAAVAGAEDTAFRVGSGPVAHGGDVGDVGVFGVDLDGADLLGVGKAHVLPGLAGVGGLVDPVAVGGVAAKVGLAHAGVDDVGVGVRDGDGADGAELDLFIGDGEPVHAAVGGLPDASAGGTHVEGHGLGLDAGDGADASAAERADLAEGEPGEGAVGFVFLSGCLAVRVRATGDRGKGETQRNRARSWPEIPVLGLVTIQSQHDAFPLRDRRARGRRPNLLKHNQNSA